MDETSTELTPEVIAQAAQQPAEGSVDGRSAKAHSISEMIAADKYAKQSAALPAGKSGWGKVRMGRAIPPGAT